MAKKFNKEERKAILTKANYLAQERYREMWNEKVKNYVPSEAYIKAKNLMEQHNLIFDELNTFPEISGYYYNKFNIKDKLLSIRDNEIRKEIPAYIYNETMLDCELILMCQENPLDQIIESLVDKCFK